MSFSVHVETAAFCKSMLEKHWPNCNDSPQPREELTESDLDLLYDFAEYARRIHNLCEKSYEEFAFQTLVNKEHDARDISQWPNGLLNAYGESECEEAACEVEILRMIDAVGECDINRIKAIIATII